MAEIVHESEYIENFIHEYDDDFVWYVPDYVEKNNIIDALEKEIQGNPHFHISKYMDTIEVLAKHKNRSEVLFLLSDKSCAMIHLKLREDEEKNLKFSYFSNCNLAMKYMAKRYRVECLGEKEFLLGKKDKIQIGLFILQLILFLVLPDNMKRFSMIASGLILYLVILSDWKNNGFNPIKNRDFENIKIIPLLKYQVAYILIMTLLIIAGVVLTLMIGFV